MRQKVHTGIDIGSWISPLASRHLMESGRSELSLTSGAVLRTKTLSNIDQLHICESRVVRGWGIIGTNDCCHISYDNYAKKLRKWYIHLILSVISALQSLGFKRQFACYEEVFATACCRCRHLLIGLQSSYFEGVTVQCPR